MVHKYVRTATVDSFKRLYHIHFKSLLDCNPYFLLHTMATNHHPALSSDSRCLVVVWSTTLYGCGYLLLYSIIYEGRMNHSVGIIVLVILCAHCSADKEDRRAAGIPSTNTPLAELVRGAFIDSWPLLDRPVRVSIS